MTTLPTCWWCRAPGCGFVAHRNIEHHDMIEVPIIPPGTPLPRILDALGHTYREGWGLFYDQPETEWSASPHQHENDVPVLVVDNPATDEEA